MRDGAFIVMVEVKVRRGEANGSAEEAISSSKGRKLLATGESYIGQHPDIGDDPWKIDLVAITIDSRGAVSRVTHIPDAVVLG